MKKRKLLLSTLAAAVFATSAGALVACGDGLELPNGVDPNPTPSTGKTYTVTFVPGADAKLTQITGETLTTDKNGKLSGTMPEAEKNENNEDYTFLGWGLAAGATVPTITKTNFTTYPFTEDKSVYAVFKENDAPGPGPGPVVTTEYEITFENGTNGTVSKTKVTTVDGEITAAMLPTVTPEEGWRHTGWVSDGFAVTFPKTFAGEATVIPTYEEISEPGPVLEPTGNDIYAGDTVFANLTDNTVNIDSEENPTRTAEYMSTGNDITEMTTLQFKVDGAVVEVWVECPTTMKVGVGDGYATGEKDKGKRGTSIKLVAGTYDFYLQYYTDGGADGKGGYRLWVCGTQTGEWEGGDDPIVTTDAKVVIGTQEKGMTDNTVNIDSEKNPTRTAEYMSTGNPITEMTTLQFKVDGAAVEVWVECPETMKVGVGDGYATGEKDKGKRGTSIKLVAGTYDFYLQYYTDGGADGQGGYRLWVAGTQTGTWEGGGEEYEESLFYLYGNVGGEEKYSTATGYIFEEIRPDADETNVSKKYKVEVALSAGDTVKIFKTEAADDTEAWKYNNYEQEWAYAKYENNDLQILQTGTFTFFFKLYKNGGDSVWINFTASGEEVDPTPAKDGLYVNGELVAELTETDTPNYNAARELSATGVMFSAGDEVVIKIDGKALTHVAGVLELWLATDFNPHGVYLDQSTGIFKIKAGATRAFNIYARYYTSGNVCWSVDFSDGLEDTLVMGGAYLLGSGFENASWNLSADNYIDPTVGLTVKFTSLNAEFKIATCKDVNDPDKGRDWNHNTSSHYSMAAGSTGLNFSNIGATGNGKVTALGTYRITVTGEGANARFVFEKIA